VIEETDGRHWIQRSKFDFCSWKIQQVNIFNKSYLVVQFSKLEQTVNQKRESIEKNGQQLRHQCGKYFWKHFLSDRRKEIFRKLLQKIRLTGAPIMCTIIKTKISMKLGSFVSQRR